MTEEEDRLLSFADNTDWFHSKDQGHLCDNDI